MHNFLSAQLLKCAEPSRDKQENRSASFGNNLGRKSRQYGTENKIYITLDAFLTNCQPKIS